MKYNRVIILLLIYIATIVFSLYLSKIYFNSSNSVTDSFVDDYFFDVTGRSYDDLYSNISNYNEENNNYIIYVSSSNDSHFDSIQGLFKNNYRNKILYINSSLVGSINSINALINSFCDGCSNLSREKLPIFICFKNKKVVDIVSVKDISEDELNSLLEVYYD